MKSTGIVRSIDNLGRIVIPMEIRKTMKINNGDPIEIFVDGDGIVLRRYDENATLLDAANALDQKIRDGDYTENRKALLEKMNELKELLR